MKKFVSLFSIIAITISILASCGTKEGTNLDTGDVKTEEKKDNDTNESILKIGMVTDTGTIDDKSFNQGTWEGILKYEEDNSDKVSAQYLKPIGEAKEDYLNAINDLIDSGHKMIITPGFKFEEAIFIAQSEYPDVYFTIIDGNPHAGDYIPSLENNTSSIFFAEEEAGFYGGLAAALESNTGKLAFIGGMVMPAVQKFGWGFTAGVAYANENFGTDVQVAEFVYQGTFDDVAAGKTLAASFYDSGVDIIFAAAGGVGVGVIDEGKTRRLAGEDIWVVGVDVDQYTSGIYNNNGDSVILTSAVKGLGTATYASIDSVVNNEFKGGIIINSNTKSNGVGLSDTTMYLSDASLKAYRETFEKVKKGDLTVPNNADKLKIFLEDIGYVTPKGINYTGENY